VTTSFSSDSVAGVPGLEDDAEASRIVSEELHLLSTVQQALVAGAGADVSAARGRVLDEDRMLELRELVAVAKPEDLPALFEQMHTLGALRAQRGRSVVGSVDRECPYFGHLRLEEEVPGPARGTSKARRRDVLIGARSYLSTRDGIRIVDWRNAPVSRIYYRYGEGDGYEEQFGDKLVEGVVVTRRGVSIARGELVRVSAPQGTFVRSKDGRWRRTLVRFARLATEKKWVDGTGAPPPARLGLGGDGQARQDKHLPAIASLLDQKQFELIAHPAGDRSQGSNTGLVAIQGSAGSGKTTVGLHRMAYLAFQDPQRFRPDKMLVVVPNLALMHYMSRVLPSLGVEGVPSTTFARFAARLVGHLFPRMPSKVSEETPAVVSRAKSHPAMLRGIDRIVERVAADVDAQVRASMANWPGGADVAEAWQATEQVTERAALAPPDLRVSLASQWLGGKRALAGTAAATSLADVTRSAFEQLLTTLRARTRAVSAVWDELLTSRESLEAIFPRAPRIFSDAQLEQVHDWCVRQTRIRVEGEREGDEPTLDAEDFALLLRSWQKLRGPILDPDGKPLRFAHIFVDEVQDASPVELRILLELTGAERSITLAGDVAQRMLEEGDDRGEFDWNALLEDLGASHTRLEPLRVSYRSTAEITQFARSVLGPLSHDAVPETTRQGPPVELFQFASIGEAVAWLAEALKQLAYDEPDANVAIVSRFPQQADVYFDGLARAEVTAVRRVANQDFAWEPGVDVTDVRQTKGLEFDEVILVETTASSYPVTPAARHALYVGATRASHQLWCLTSDAPSELVTVALEASASAVSEPELT
jgi:DNA helicase-2/ATP-dependent DNA helicase PcrA